MTSNAELSNDQEDEEYCPECWRREIAMEMLRMAVHNALAHDCEPHEVVKVCSDVLDEVCGPDEPLEGIDQPAAGSA